jgi:hypothetical protein
VELPPFELRLRRAAAPPGDAPAEPPGAPATPLLCRLGLHRAERGARWNQGLFFSRCERCGRSLVRSEHGRWRVPHGYRVVWRPLRPGEEAVPPPSAVPGGARFAPAGRGAELPIERVLRHLHATSPPEEAALAPDIAIPVADVLGRARFGDFMNDGAPEPPRKAVRPSQDARQEAESSPQPAGPRNGVAQ